MAVRPIRITGDPVLHRPTRAVTEFDDTLRVLVADMQETMAAADGVGLAANQIGADLRVFVFDCPDEVAGVRVRGVVVNPVLETSERPETMPDPEGDEEGCLSVPGEAFPTGRADWARVTGVDVGGEPVAFEGHGFLARCFQHEVDHLDGVLYVDRLVGRNRRAALRTLKQLGWGVPGLAWDPGPSIDAEGPLAGPSIDAEGPLAGPSIDAEGPLAGPSIDAEGPLAGPSIDTVQVAEDL